MVWRVKITVKSYHMITCFIMINVFALPNKDDQITNRPSSCYVVNNKEHFVEIGIILKINKMLKIRFQIAI